MDVSILRTARLQARLSKAELASLTKLSPRIVAAIDEGRLAQLPGGLYARSFLRTYAEAVGIDAATVKEMIDALPAMDVDLATVIDARQHRPAIDDFEESTRRRAAAIIDMAVVAFVSAGEVLACFLIAGLGIPDIATASVAALALAVPTLTTYIGLLGATGFGTIGARTFEIEFVPPLDGPVDGTALLQRTVEYLRRELTVLFTGKDSIESCLHS